MKHDQQTRRYFMIKATLKDGSVKEFAKGVTILEAAKAIHHGLAKEAWITGWKRIAIWRF
jgi:hypothetical protein